MNKNNKGFTLAELLIVVAIIAVLVGISIPVFTTQLEKARDATSLANLRAAYAEASVAYMTKESTGRVEVSENSLNGTPITYIIVHGVELTGKKSDNFSGNIDSLPFLVLDYHTQLYAEPAPDTYSIEFDFDNNFSEWTEDEPEKMIALLWPEQ